MFNPCSYARLAKSANLSSRRPMRFVLTLLALLVASWFLACTSLDVVAKEQQQALTPGDPIDFAPLAFYPDRWRKHGVPLEMVPWKGEHVVFLTNTAELDGAVMADLLGKLDAGWQHYAKLTGQQPRLFKQIDGVPTIAAIPGGHLTCGYGCGYVGSTGIELSAFYARDYENIKKNARNVPDYYFYEMGRNYYTFGNQHSCFITGFAVFMRYVCMDKLELTGGKSTRKTIESAIDEYAKTDVPFLKAFTTLDGLSEKKNRLKISPSDQPVMYASAMLKLRKDHGGDEWVERFFKQLATCPTVKPDTKEAGLKQSLNWLVAASCAAGKDLSPVFVDQWRMPMSPEGRKAFQAARWDDPRINAGQVVRNFLR